MYTNDWNLRQEMLLTPLPLSELTQEQSVELDYVLPDYYPDFFRLLHCTAEAAVTSQTVTDGTVQYMLRVQLHVLYNGEQTKTVQSVTQQLDYHGQMNLPPEAASAGNLQIRISAEPSYLNCRAVSPRRIDLRGAMRIRAELSGEQQIEVLSQAEGLHTRTRSETVSYVSQLLRTQKPFTLSDEIRLSAAQPALLSVLRTKSDLSVLETRVVAGKMVVKGEATVTVLYTSSEGIESLTAVLPFSQIVEMEGLSDDMPCPVTAILSEQSITAEAENNGDIRLLHCDLQIILQCEAIRTASASLLNDLYSTVHPAELRRAAVPLLTAPVTVSERLQQKTGLTQPDAVLTKVYAAWADPEQLQTAQDPEGGILLNGVLHFCALAADAEGDTLMLEAREPFTWPLPQLHAAGLLPPVQAASTTYTLTGSDTVTVQTELLLSGQVLQQQRHELLTDVRVDPEARLPMQENYALRLYFGQPEESLWEIAKRYHTSETAIREENDISGDTLTAAQTLLIPIVR
ncbi:MAG: DUF3794 domain-containing protein [Oscillospiraceae bacterium]|nr:DUF3794 domain-containing protein [Oscillospiraceae bacterium]